MMSILTKQHKKRWGYFPYLVLCLALCTILACSKDSDPSGELNHKHKQSSDFRLLSVQSYEKGKTIDLSLNMLFADDYARALTLNEREDTGELAELRIAEREQLHIFIRKEGDDNSYTSASLTWQGRDGKKLSLDKISIALPEGYNINPGERWYVMGILGGEFDPSSKTVHFGGNSKTISLQSLNTLDVPYSFAWQALDIESANTVSIPETTLKARGAVLRMHFYSDLIGDYDLHGFALTSNALQAQGSFAPFDTSNDAVQSGLSAPWTSLTPSLGQPQTWLYELATSPIRMPAGSAHNMGQTLYVWAMPTNSQNQEELDTQVELMVRQVGTDKNESLQSYHKQAHRPLQEGRSYRISNVLTSPLMISELYYQFAPKGSNPNKPNEQQVYSIVELYNPTASMVSLADYALVRTGYQDDGFTLFSSGRSTTGLQTTLGEATILPLAAVLGRTISQENASKFSGNTQHTAYSGTWHKRVYGFPTLNLRPGHTILIGAGGYVATNHKPSANIELFNRSNAQGGSTLGIEQAHLPRAGMQADSAQKAGYAQFMVALDNGVSKGASPRLSERAGVLQLGNAQGVALIRATPLADGGYQNEIVDISTPLGNQAEEREAFLDKLRTAGISTDAQTASSYSIVRRKGVFPRKNYKSDEWVIAESENDGVKSLGSRDYVAGLSPFKPNYTGYNQSNNPKGNPFWGTRRATQHFKVWGNLPESGTNYPADASGMGDSPYKKVPVASGSASREDAGDVFAKSYDGNYDSRFWGAGPMPVTLTYNLKQAETLTHISYRSWDAHHSINEYAIRVVYADGSTRDIAMPPLGSPYRTTTKITWEGIEDKPIKTVIFTVYSVGGGRSAAVSFYEMEFYTHDDKYVDPSPLFKDLSCTELKDGLTYEEIKNFPNPFYREIARKLYLNNYPKEFRIEDYKAWTHPNYQQGFNKNQFPYSLIDNPTGMYFELGEEVIVLVGDTKGHHIKLKVVDPFHDNGYRAAQDYELKPGFNRLSMRAPGHGYILYHVNELDIDRSAHPDIRVHFPIGTAKVNGYYDAYKPSHRGRWLELLGKAQERHFDVLGRHAHLLFRTDAFKARVPDAQPLVDVFDKIVYEEMSMMGLLMNNKAKIYRNRLPYTRWYGGFLYAHYYHTAYGSDIVDHTSIPQGSWGLAHETGHMNQTTGYNWGGQIEISTNLHAFYIEHFIFKRPSRAQDPNDRGNPSIPDEDRDRFNRAWNALLETNRTLSAESNAFNSLIPFIQLQLYFGAIRGMTPTEENGHTGFLPRMYENLRNANYHGKDDGAQQVEITYHASRAAGYDLTDFFERWGFYRPANNLVHYNTYWNTFSITLTQAQVDNVKARIKALNLPKLPDNLAIEYITVLNRELYRSYKPIVPGTVHKDGQNFTLSGWRNVAAWEVRTPGGKLLYTSSGGTVELDATYTVNYPTENLIVQSGDKFQNRIDYPTWDDSYILYAIDAKGQKVQAYPVRS